MDLPAFSALGAVVGGVAMSSRLLVLRHEPETGLGRFGPLLDAADVDYELVPTTYGSLPEPNAFDGALVLGGSLAADDATLLETRRWIRNAALGGLPYLGVCLGGQLLADVLGARVTRARPEAGVHSIFLTDAAAHDPLFAGLPGRLDVLGWHSDSFRLPHGAVPLAGSLGCTYEAFRYGAAAYGLQFHPEVGPQDLVRWRHVPGYCRLLEDRGGDWDDVIAALERATKRFDELAAQLLERWLYLVVGVAALRETVRIAA